MAAGMPDFVRFKDGERTLLESAWNGRGGGWPPPERLALVIGSESGTTSVVALEGLAADVRAALDACETITVREFARASYSKFTDEEIDEMDHVVRGAEYQPAEVLV